MKNLPIVLILLVSILLRVYGIDSHEVPDEFFEVNRSLNILEGEFDWSRITKGGLYIILTPIYFITSIFSQDYMLFLFIGRLVQVLIGISLIWFIYKNIKLLYGRNWALLFVIPSVFCFRLVYDAHHVNVQNLMFLCITIHLFLVIKGLIINNVKLLGTSLIPLAIATASQISAAIIILPFFFLSIILYTQSDYKTQINLTKAMLKYGVGSVGIYILLTPGIVLEFGSALRYILGLLGVTYQIESKAGTEISYVTVKNISYWSEYGRYMLNSFGKLNCVLLFISTIVVVFRKNWILIYPMSIFFSFFFIFVNASQTVYGGRYIIPALLMGYVIMPEGLVGLSYWLKKYQKNVRDLVLTIGVILLSLNFGRNAFFTWDKVKNFSLPDTRDIVSNWLSKNTLKEDKILLEKTCNYPKLPHKEQAVYVDNWNTYPVLEKIKEDYIIINKSSIDYLDSKKVKTSYQNFYVALITSNNWSLVKSEISIHDKTVGPEIVVYKIK